MGRRLTTVYPVSSFLLLPCLGLLSDILQENDNTGEYDPIKLSVHLLVNCPEYSAKRQPASELDLIIT